MTSPCHDDEISSTVFHVWLDQQLSLSSKSSRRRQSKQETALPGLGSRAEYPQEDGCSPSFLFVVCGVVVFFVRLSIRTSASTRFVICAVAFVVLTDFQEKEEFGPMCKVVIECASHHQGPSQAFAPFWHIYLGPEQLLSFYFPLSSAIFSVAASGS